MMKWLLAIWLALFIFILAIMFLLTPKKADSSEISCLQVFSEINKELTISRQHEAILATKLQTLENEIQEIMKFYLIDKNKGATK